MVLDQSAKWGAIFVDKILVMGGDLLARDNV